MIEGITKGALSWAASTEGTIAILGAIGYLGYVGRVIFAKLAAMRGARAVSAFECLQLGVAHTYETYTGAIKAASADGHLTEEEKKESARRAIEKGEEYAKTKGLDLAKELGREALPGLVETAVGLAKDRVPLAGIENRLRSVLGRIR